MVRATPPRPDPVEVERALRVLCEPGSVYELRVPNTKHRTLSGYYDDLDKLARDAVRSNALGTVFVTLNPVMCALLGRANNHVVEYAKHTTGDSEILHRRWILLDLDPVRPAGVSSTDEEHTAALSRAGECWDWLIAQGIRPDSMVLASSGNGAHILIRVDLPNDKASQTLVNRVLQAVAFRFSDDRVDVDTGTGNASRLVKLYGTVATKGEGTDDRPHRQAVLQERRP